MAKSKSKRWQPAAAPGPMPQPPAPETETETEPEPAALATNVIDIPSSPDPPSKKAKGTKRRPPSPIDLDRIEMWTPCQKRRLDDECCILSTNPFAAAELIPAAAAVANDDVAVVAERGKVACRDFPHPRSACAKYPFSKTPHENHCDKCFCYVCDIAAPCLSWNGQEHCHASHKDKKWKVKRAARQKAKQA